MVTVGSVDLAEGMDGDSVKKLDDGLYVPADDTFSGKENDVTEPFDSNRIFKFTTAEDSANCTLTILNGKNEEVYKESGTFSKAGGNFFYICLKASEDAPNSSTESTYGKKAFDAGDYYYTVTSGDDVLLKGTFSVVAE